MTTSGSRVRGTDGVRAIAAASIVIYHCWLYGGATGSIPMGAVGSSIMPHLALGVTVFFTLSGFLLYRPFVAGLLRGTDRPRFRSYLRNRALRIFPAYWVILLIVSLVLGAAVTPNDRPGLNIGTLAMDPPVLLGALALVQSYSPLTLFVGIGPAWSLSVEVAFYVALPLLVLLAWMAARGRSIAWRRAAALLPPLVLLAIGLSGRLFAAYVAPAVPTTGGDVSLRDVVAFSAWAKADLFAGGMILALVHVELEERNIGVTAAARRALILVAILVAIPAILLSYGEGLAPYVYESLASVVTALFLAAIVSPPREHRGASSVLRFLESPLIAGLGLISYSLFLWHEPLIHLLRGRGFAFDGPLGLVMEVGIVGTGAVLLAGVTYRLVERPVLGWKQRYARPRAADQDGGLAVESRHSIEW